MWLQRIMFNVKARLLNQTRDTSAIPHPPSSAPLSETTRAQVIQNRLIDIDRRQARLLAK